MAAVKKPILGIAIKNNAIEGCSCSGGSSVAGKDGASAYQIAVMQGFTGTVDEWLMSLKGIDGKEGASAYQIAVMQGFAGSMTDWLLSLKGADGKDGRDGRDGVDGKDGKDGKDGRDGKSAYEIAVENGFKGTESEWLESLKGGPGSSAEVTKESIGLGNVDNTADADKNVLSATKLTTPRKISFSGAFTALTTFDGSEDVTVNVESVDATKLTGIIPWVNLPEILVDGSAQADILETNESSPAFIKNKEAITDIVKPALLDMVAKKVEISGELIPGAFVVADANGNLTCTTSVPGGGGNNETTVVAGVTVTVKAIADGGTTVEIPEGIHPDNFTLYCNGTLLVKGIGYTVSDDTVHLIGITTYVDDYFTFIGYTGTSSTANIGIATETVPGLVKSSNGVNEISVAADGTMSIAKIDASCLVSTSGIELILNGGSAN